MKLGKFVLLVIVVNCALFGAFTYSASKSGLTALNNLHRKKVQGLKYYHRNVDGSQLFVLMSTEGTYCQYTLPKYTRHPEVGDNIKCDWDARP